MSGVPRPGRRPGAWVEKTCGGCGKAFRVTPSRATTARYCCKECTPRPKRPDTKVEKRCLTCAKAFRVSPYRAEEARYCSTKCNPGPPRRGRDVTCPVCGKIFYERPSVPQRYCSRTCFSKANRVSRTCAVCGVAFSTWRSEAQRGPSEYCSRACFGEAFSRARSVELTCGFCGKTFRKPRAFAEKHQPRYCSQACNGKAYARAHALELTCPVCLKKFQTTKSAVELGKKCCSERCRKQWQLGPNTSQWQGGKTFWTTVQSRGRNWPRQSRKARKRDNYTCQRCGKTETELGVPFHAHHVVPYFNFTSSRKANRLNNLICLCPSCHKKEDHRAAERQMVLIGKF